MIKRNSIVLGAGLALIVTIAGLAWFNRDEMSVPTSAQDASPTNPPVLSHDTAAAFPAPAGTREAISTAATNPAAVGANEDNDFSVDAQGRLVRNEKARLKLEELFALNTPAELERKLADLEQTLPPEAATEVRDLMARYENYQSAQLQTFPPGREPASTDEAFNEIDGMHALRVQYFGAETAQAFFGSEEKVQRELLRLMSLEKDQSLTREERAERAQAIYAQMAETNALTERANQQAAAEPRSSPPR